METAGDSLSLSLWPSPLLALSLFLCKKKINNKSKNGFISSKNYQGLDLQFILGGVPQESRHWDGDLHACSLFGNDPGNNTCERLSEGCKGEGELPQSCSTAFSWSWRELSAEMILWNRPELKQKCYINQSMVTDCLQGRSIAVKAKDSSWKRTHYELTEANTLIVYESLDPYWGYGLCTTASTTQILQYHFLFQEST